MNLMMNLALTNLQPEKVYPPDEVLNIMNPADNNLESEICYEDYTKQSNPQIITLVTLLQAHPT